MAIGSRPLFSSRGNSASHDFFLAGFARIDPLDDDIVDRAHPGMRHDVRVDRGRIEPSAIASSR